MASVHASSTTTPLPLVFWSSARVTKEYNCSCGQRVTSGAGEEGCAPCRTSSKLRHTMPTISVQHQQTRQVINQLEHPACPPPSTQNAPSLPQQIILRSRPHTCSSSSSLRFLWMTTRRRRGTLRMPCGMGRRAHRRECRHPPAIRPPRPAVEITHLAPHAPGSRRPCSA